MQVFIDNIPVTNKTATLMKPSITWRKKDTDGAKAFSFTGDISFYGTDYDYIKSKLWQNLDNAGNNIALQTEVRLRFEDECCSGFPLEFRISAESIQWCEGSCEVTAVALETSVEEDAVRCVRNTLVTDNTPTNWPDSVPFKQRKHPRFVYCNEIRPQWQMVLLMQFALITSLFLSIIIPVYAVIQIVITAINSVINTINNILGTSINTIKFKDDPGLTPFQEGRQIVDNILSTIVACGRKHPSPLVRDYVQNVCGKCGLTFSSSIFNDSNSDYFNTAYFNAPVDKGVKPSDTGTFWVDSNQPIKSGEQFLNDLCDTFNAKWEIKGNVLSFERKDFNVNPVPWVDTNTLENYDICFSWSKKSRFAYANFLYQTDTINTIGAEAVRRFSDIVEWNNPPLPNQKGEFKPLFPFSVTRFIGDKIRLSDGADSDIYTLFRNTPVLGGTIRKFDRAMLLNEHVCFLPMLLIWDGQNKDAAFVDPNQFIPAPTGPNFPAFQNNSKATPPGEYFNYPLWFDAQMPNNMYDRFWSIENPRSNGFQGKAFTLTVEMTCDLLSNADLDGTVNTSEGIGHINQIEFNFAAKTITITGEI